MNGLGERLRALLGAGVASAEPLGGGCVARVVGATLTDGRRVVAKIDEGGGGGLDAEVFMLRWLAERTRLPVPRVLAADAGRLLVMDRVPGSTGAAGAAEEHAAELLAALHGITADRFGFERETRVGGLPQPNPWTGSWAEFFGRHRLVFMAHEARRAGRLGAGVADRVERLAGRLDRWIAEPDRPGLVHGDVWSGNVLAGGGRITAFLDPAIYFAEPEVELAFITLFGCFGERFFRRYGALRPIRAGFFEERRHLYNLYPLLVHARLFGGGYGAAVERTLSSFGV